MAGFDTNLGPLLEWPSKEESIDPREQITVAQGVGEIKGLVHALNDTVSKHLERDDTRFDRADERFEKKFAEMEAKFDTLNDRFEEKFQDLKDQRGADIAAAYTAQAETRKWKWTMIWTVGGVVVGAVCSVIVGIVLHGQGLL